MNTYYIAGFPITDELYHYGIKGQKWGIRRYQNEDGSLTVAGYERYYGSNAGKKAQRDLNNLDTQRVRAIRQIIKQEMKINRLQYDALRLIKRNTDENGVSHLNKRPTRKLIKLATKYAAAKEANELATKNIKEIESAQQNLISTISKQGYDVFQKPIYREAVTTGERFVNSFLFGAIGPSMMEAYKDGLDENFVQGTKFKVRK